MDTIKSVGEFDLSPITGKVYCVSRVVNVNNQIAEIHINPALRNDSLFAEVLVPAFCDGISAGRHFRMIVGFGETFERKLDEYQKRTGASDLIAVAYEIRSNWILNSQGRFHFALVKQLREAPSIQTLFDHGHPLPPVCLCERSFSSSFSLLPGQTIFQLPRLR